MHFGSTSYLPVWLVFTPTHRSSEDFSTSTVRSSLCYQASTCPWVDHKVSRLILLTMRPIPDSLSLRLRTWKSLTSLVKLTRRLIMQRHAVTGSCAPTACRRTVSGSISPRLFTVLFTFPSQYLFTIGLSGYLALDGAHDSNIPIQQDFTCPALLILSSIMFRLQGSYHPLMAVLSRTFF